MRNGGLRFRLPCAMDIRGYELRTPHPRPCRLRLRLVPDVRCAVAPVSIPAMRSPLARTTDAVRVDLNVPTRRLPTTSSSVVHARGRMVDEAPVSTSANEWFSALVTATHNLPSLYRASDKDFPFRVEDVRSTT